MQSENLAAVAEAPSSPGAQLRHAREARGETVQEVAFALKLNPRQVEALERDDFSALPGIAFVRGFMRNYARHLGLDATPLLDAVQRLVGQGTPDLSPIRNADGDLPVGDGRRRGSFPAGLVVLVLLVMVATGWYFDWFRTDSAPLAETVAEPLPGFAPAPTQPAEPQPAESQPAESQSPDLQSPDLQPTESQPATSAVQLTPPLPRVIEPAAGAAAREEAAAPAVGTEAAVQPVTGTVAAAASGAPSNPSAVSPEPAAAVVAPEPLPAPGAGAQLSFRFGAESWVEVRDASGTILHSGVNRAGSTRSVQGTAPFTLVVGNASSVTLEHDGKPVDLAAHIRGSVARLTLR